MITDLWYDQPSHCVMGKLEVLDTPNGQIARKLIDAGYPLFVSSRAAGEVETSESIFVAVVHDPGHGLGVNASLAVEWREHGGVCAGHSGEALFGEIAVHCFSPCLW